MAERLTRTIVLETELSLTLEQIQRLLDLTAHRCGVHSQRARLDDIVRPEELCLVASCLKGPYKDPAFIGAEFGSLCLPRNPCACAET